MQKIKLYKMIKRILVITGFAFLIASCGNNADNTTNGNTIDSTSVTEATNVDKTEAENIVDINKFEDEAGNYVNNNIVIEGTCVHTCKHGGGKMHIVGDDPESRVVIIATDASGKFNAEMEGTKYKVIGKVIETRIDSAYLANMEAEILAGEEGGEKEGVKHNHGSEGDNATPAEEKEMKLMQVDNMRKELAESGKDHLSFYNIECVSYEPIKE